MSDFSLYQQQLNRPRHKAKAKKVMPYNERQAAVAGIALFIKLDGARKRSPLVKRKMIREALEPFGAGEKAVERIMNIPLEIEGEGFKVMFCKIIKETTVKASQMAVADSLVGEVA